MGDKALPDPHPASPQKGSVCTQPTLFLVRNYFVHLLIIHVQIPAFAGMTVSRECYCNLVL
jgi:hypothetical protein